MKLGNEDAKAAETPTRKSEVVDRVTMRKVDRFHPGEYQDGDYLFESGGDRIHVKLPGVPYLVSFELADKNSDEGRVRAWNGDTQKPSFTDGSVAVCRPDGDDYLFHGYIKNGVIEVLSE